MLLATLLALLAFQEPTFRSEVTLVHVDAEVRAGDRLIDGLTKDDFRIADDGPREILHFAHQEVPIDVILVFDTSASMFPAVERVAQTARAALGQLRAGDRAAVMAFDRDTDVIAGFTDDFGEVERVIRENVLRREFVRMSRLQEAARAAALYFLKQPREGRRRAIVMITDNLGSSREGRALADLWEADAVLSGVVVRAAAMRVTFSIIAPQSLFGVGDIKEFAERTGGDLLNAGDAGEGFRQMIQRLRLRYSLEYAMPPAKPGEQRKIKVELTDAAKRRYRDAKVRARSGYIVPAEPR